VDPAYRKLNLTAKNMEQLTHIECYEVAKESIIEDASDIARIFKIKDSALKNKKMVAAIRDLCASDVNFASKVAGFKKMVAAMEDSTLVNFKGSEFGPEDWLDLSGVGSDSNLAEPKEGFDRISKESIWIIYWNMEAISALKNHLFKGMTKKMFMRFMRTLKGEESYFSDILEMMSTCLEGIETIRNRLSEMAKDAPERSETERGLEMVERALEEVSSNEDAEFMHDRLSAAVETLSQDRAQNLNQKRYEQLEEDPLGTQRTGVRLYFPKSRGDLIDLGSMHGWCVSSVGSYGDDVIAKGNILVGLVPKNKKSCIENCVALAHFEKDGSQYHLEQLKWSKLKKDKSNVDATQDFNHAAIAEEIKSHIEGMESANKEAA